MNKLILVGIDAATFDVIEPLLNQGELPTIASLMKDGVHCRLKSLRGYKSPALWTTISTGKMPEKNGILYFSNLFIESPKLRKRKDLTSNILVNWPYQLGKFFSHDQKNPSDITTFSRRLYVYLMLKYGRLFERVNLGGNYLVTSSFRTEKTIWEILSEHKLVSGVVGWLVTWPADKIHGFLVSQKAIEGLTKVYETSTKFKIKDQGKITSPEELLGELQQFNRSPASIADEEISSFFHNLNSTDKEQIRSTQFDRKNRFNFFTQLYLSDIFSTKVGVYLQEKYNPHFLTVYLPGLDGIQHIFWQQHRPKDFAFLNMSKEEIEKYGDTVRNYYKFLDGQIAQLIKKDATIIIASDHGMESILQKHYDPKAIRSGQHEESPHGILIMNGPQIKKGITLETAHIVDIAPTVLYALGKEIDEGMEGSVLTEAFDQDFVKNHSIKQKQYGRKERKDNSFYEQEDQQEVKERLKALGYLD